MHAKRILIVNNMASLLMDGVNGLLELHGTNFDVLRSHVLNLPDLIQQVEKRNPDVIILEEPSSLLQPVDLFAFFLRIRNIRLIIINLQTSKIDIYDRSEREISRLDHFFEAVHSEADPFSF
jgi:hypothetical protein